MNYNYEISKFLYSMYKYGQARIVYRNEDPGMVYRNEDPGIVYCNEDPGIVCRSDDQKYDYIKIYITEEGNLNIRTDSLLKRLSLLVLEDLKSEKVKNYDSNNKKYFVSTDNLQVLPVKNRKFFTLLLMKIIENVIPSIVADIYEDELNKDYLYENIVNLYQKNLSGKTMDLDSSVDVEAYIEEYDKQLFINMINSEADLREVSTLRDKLMDLYSCDCLFDENIQALLNAFHYDDKNNNLKNDIDEYIAKLRKKEK